MCPQDDQEPAPPEDAEETELLGTYATWEEFAQAAVESLVLPEGLWLLECLDFVRVRERMEGRMYRFRLEGGRVLRDRLRQPPGR